VEIFLWSSAIFIGRIVDVTLGTIRVNLIVRKRKIFAAIIGFIEVSIFALVIARVIQDLDNNIFGILAYGAGFAGGTLIGITLSERLSKDLISTNIMSKAIDCDMEITLRQEGFGATCMNGLGKEGEVKVINVVCRSFQLPKLSKTVRSVDPDAFIVSHTLDKQQGGFLYGLKSKK
jgi:uncharacterized protein YebE (UPF0316 family)